MDIISSIKIMASLRNFFCHLFQNINYFEMLPFEIIDLILCFVDIKVDFELIYRETTFYDNIG